MRYYLILTIVILLSGCSKNFHQESTYDLALAQDIITQLKEGPLILVQKTDYRKEQILRSYLSNNNAQKSEIVEKRLEELKKVTLERNQTQQELFNEHYRFGDIYFLPDSLYKKFMEGKIGAIQKDSTELYLSDYNYDPIFLIQPEDTYFYLKVNEQPVTQPLTSVYGEIPEFVKFMTSVFSGKTTYYRNQVKSIDEKLNEEYNLLIHSAR